jgi:hypothetical protein
LAGVKGKIETFLIVYFLANGLTGEESFKFETGNRKLSF